MNTTTSDLPLERLATDWLVRRLDLTTLAARYHRSTMAIRTVLSAYWLRCTTRYG